MLAYKIKKMKRIRIIFEKEKDGKTKRFGYQINQKEPISTIIKGNGTGTLFDKEGRFIKKITYAQGKPLK